VQPNKLIAEIIRINYLVLFFLAAYISTTVSLRRDHYLIEKMLTALGATAEL
jgi:hypothetical protein